MKGMKVLFEPLPIGRLGIRKDNEDVVLGTDFSSFAYMLVEFISLGALQIAIPKSFPESAALSDTPELLKLRITIVDDDSENEATERLLDPLMKEFGIDIDGNTGELFKPKNLPKPVFLAIQCIRRDLKCIALRFNHSLQVDLDSNLVLSSSRKLREYVRQPNTLAILASLEGFFSYYEDIEFDSISPQPEAPARMISIFDQLVNDPQYLKLSKTVALLSDPSQRRGALSRLRAIGRNIMSSKAITTGWNYTAKIIKAETGVPIPDSSVLSILVTDRTLPSLVNLHAARERAIKMWMTSANHNVPYRRSGVPLSGDEIHWLPPCKSLEASHPGDSSLLLGTAGEIVEALKNFQDSHIENS